MLRVHGRKHHDGTYVIYKVPNFSRGVQLMKGTSDDMFWTSEVVKRCLQLAGDESYASWQLLSALQYRTSLATSIKVRTFPIHGMNTHCICDLTISV